MKILFLDDSYYRAQKLLGYGGYCIESAMARSVADAVADLKTRYRIPQSVELKWSPDNQHFLRTKFAGSRHDLYADALKIVAQHRGRIICAVHALAECHGIKLHGWTTAQAKLWAAQQQLRYIAERLQRPFLTSEDDHGIIIVDAYESGGGAKALITHFTFDMLAGTSFEKLDRISLVPLLTDSQQCTQIQLADIIIGIVVGALGGNQHALKLFDQLTPLFLWNPHKKALGFSSMVSAAIIGFGLKLLPKDALYKAARNAFRSADESFIITNKGYIRHPGRNMGTNRN